MYWVIMYWVIMYRASTSVGVQQAHRFFPFAVDCLRHDPYRILDIGHDDAGFRLGGIVEYIVGYHGLVARVTDADAQSIKIPLASQGINDVAHAIVTAVTTAALEPDDTYLEVDFVVGNQYVFRGDLKEIADGGYRLAAAIHEGRGEQYLDVLAGDIDRARFAEELALTAQTAVIALAQMVEKDHTGIVTVGIMLRAWITQAHNQF